MEEARNVLRSTTASEVDIILAREPAQDDVNGNGNVLFNNNNNLANPVERRKRRKLPNIERPRSAPIHHHQVRTQNAFFLSGIFYTDLGVITPFRRYTESLRRYQDVDTDFVPRRRVTLKSHLFHTNSTS
jgi:hypothetical protein